MILDLAALVAREEIRTLLLTYCRAMDRGDKQLLASVYHADAVDEHGGKSSPARTFAGSIVDEMDGRGGTSQHHLTNVLIEIDGERAHAESYFMAVLPNARERRVTGSAPWVVGGRYLDHLERRAGRWGITRRRVVIDFGDSLSGASWPAASDYPVGTRGPNDLSYTHFADMHGEG